MKIIRLDFLRFDLDFRLFFFPRVTRSSRLRFQDSRFFRYNVFHKRILHNQRSLHEEARNERNVKIRRQQHVHNPLNTGIVFIRKNHYKFSEYTVWIKGHDRVAHMHTTVMFNSDKKLHVVDYVTHYSLTVKYCHVKKIDISSYELKYKALSS